MSFSYHRVLILIPFPILAFFRIFKIWVRNDSPWNHLHNFHVRSYVRLDVLFHYGCFSPATSLSERKIKRRGCLTFAYPSFRPWLPQWRICNVRGPRLGCYTVIPTQNARELDWHHRWTLLLRYLLQRINLPSLKLEDKRKVTSINYVSCVTIPACAQYPKRYSKHLRYGYGNDPAMLMQRYKNYSHSF